MVIYYNKKVSMAMQEDKTDKENLNHNNKFSILVDSAQDIGSRGNQEDAFALKRQEDQVENGESGEILAIVADGMGGLDCGEEASAIALETFLREYDFNKGSRKIDQRLLRALKISNAAVFDLAYQGGKERDLGTTIVAALIKEGKLHWISAGDSRLYLFREGCLEQLNLDHIYANHLEKEVSEGLISREEAVNHPERNYLTSYLGLPDLTEIGQSNLPLELQANDLVLICSDGLYDTLSEEEITTVLQRENPQRASQLVEAALSKGNPHQDNISVITLAVVF
jgi:PPM family protein phosphatase